MKKPKKSKNAEKTEDMFQKYIGNHPIYHEQAICANKILDVFNRNAGPPLLVAQMQQGKTGVCIAVIDQFIKNCKAQKKKYEVIFLTNLSDNAIKNQTQDRLRLAGLNSEVENIHHANLKRFKLKYKELDRRLIIVDECHVALQKSNEKSLKPFHNFLKQCGIKYGESIKTWENPNNYVLSVSATPFAHIIKTKLDENAFEIVKLDVNEKYYSLQQMKSDDRIKQSKKIYDVKSGEVSPFFKDKMEEFLDLCQSKSEEEGENNYYGHMVVRTKGEDSVMAIYDYIKNNYPNVDVETYDSVRNNNIHELDSSLGMKYPMPFVAIIRGGLRAGKTLKTTKYIRMWIDSPESKTDAACQSVGRCLGFPCEDGHEKFNDSFPVYCNTKEIDLAIEFFEEHNCIPTGNYNRTTRKVEDCDLVVFDFDGNKDAVKKEAKEKLKVNKVTLSFCSKWSVNDVCQDVTNKSYRGHSLESGMARLFCMDKASKLHGESWNKFASDFPHLVGKVVTVIPRENSIKKEVYDETKISKKCMLR